MCIRMRSVLFRSFVVRSLLSLPKYGLTVKGRHVVAGDKVSVNDYITIEVGSGQRDVDMDINYTDAPIEDAKEDEFYESGDVDQFHEVTGPTE